MGRAGIPGFAHSTADKNIKIALTRGKRRKKERSTKTPSKKHKNTKKDEKNYSGIFALTREIKPLAAKKSNSHSTPRGMKPKKVPLWRWGVNFAFICLVSFGHRRSTGLAMMS